MSWETKNICLLKESLVHTMSSGIELVSVSKDGTTEKVFSIIAFVVWMALHVFTLLPVSYKSVMSVTKPEPPYEIPYFVGISVSLHLSFNYDYSATVTDYSFHYSCLVLSNAIALIPAYLYTMLFLSIQEKRVAPGVWLMLQSLCIGVYALFMLAYVGNPTARVVSGILTTVSGIIMYATPLPLVMRSRKLENVQYILSWLCIAYFFHGLAWSIVALFASYFDPYLLIAHGVGAILGLLHLGIILNSTWCPKIYTTLKDRMSSIGFCISNKIYSCEDLKENKTETKGEAEETTLERRIAV